MSFIPILYTYDLSGDGKKLLIVMVSCITHVLLFIDPIFVNTFLL